MCLLTVEVSHKVKKIIYLLGILISVSLTSNLAFAQGINFPLGNPTGTGGAGNARTDSDNFFMRNNLAGLTEIPLNEEEENSSIRTKADKGNWRFNGEMRLLAFKHTSEYTYSNREPIFEGTSLTPNFTGEMTYTSANHRFGFGIGTYQIVNSNTRLKLIKPIPIDALGTYDTQINSSDIALGGAIRLHKKLSVGAAFIFGRAFLNFEEPNFSYLQRLSVDGIGAAGLSVSLHYRPTSFLSFGANYKSKRKYGLSGEVKESPGSIIYFPLRDKINVQTELEIPTIAEAGLEIRPFRKLLVAADFRFYDYTATLKSPFDLRKPNGDYVYAFFNPQYLFALDVHSFHIGGKYSLSNKTNVQFGVTTNSNTTNVLRRDLKDLGVVFSGALSQQLGNKWITLGFAALPGRTRTEYPFLDNSRDRGFLFSVGLRMKQ